jgi:hypothetical protein
VKEWKYHPDAANSVLLWAQQNLGEDGQCIYHQPQDVENNQARTLC